MKRYIINLSTKNPGTFPLGFLKVYSVALLDDQNNNALTGGITSAEVLPNIVSPFSAFDDNDFTAWNTGASTTDALMYATTSAVVPTKLVIKTSGTLESASDISLTVKCDDLDSSGAVISSTDLLAETTLNVTKATSSATFNLIVPAPAATQPATTTTATTTQPATTTTAITQQVTTTQPATSTANKFRAVVTTTKEDGLILKVDSSLEGSQFVGKNTESYIADVETDQNGNVIAINRVKSVGPTSLLNLPNFGTEPDDADKLQISAIKKKLKLNQALMPKEKVQLILKSRIDVDLVMDKLSKGAKYDDLRLLGISDDNTLAILTANNIKSEPSNYSTEEQLQIACSSVDMLKKFSAFVVANGGVMPSLSDYLDVLRRDPVIFGMASRFGQKVK